jgi:sugar/nucleoside kinase (ribokinase family)
VTTVTTVTTMTSTPTYILIGHVAHDETPDGPRLGGTVSYAGSAVRAMGTPVGIVTSAERDEVVLTRIPAGIQLHLIEAPQTTHFVNTYVDGKRRQVLRQRALTLTLDHVPVAWRSAPIIHLAPLDDEVDPALAFQFPGALVAGTPQGWMRAWDAEGVVFRKPWAHAERLLPQLDVTVFSEEDIQWDTALEAHYAALAKLLVVTRAANGCTVYQRGQPPIHIPAPSVAVVDATGAGDVFAGVFLVVLQRTQNVALAARVATQLASNSVTRLGLDGAPTPDEIADITRTLSL